MLVHSFVLHSEEGVEARLKQDPLDLLGERTVLPRMERHEHDADTSKVLTKDGIDTRGRRPETGLDLGLRLTRKCADTSLVLTL